LRRSSTGVHESFIFISDAAPIIIFMKIKTKDTKKEYELLITGYVPTLKPVKANMVDIAMNMIIKIVADTASLFLPFI
jgi:hypothetical protein